MKTSSANKFGAFNADCYKIYKGQFQPYSTALFFTKSKTILHRKMPPSHENNVLIS